MEARENKKKQKGFSPQDYGGMGFSLSCALRWGVSSQRDRDSDNDNRDKRAVDPWMKKKSVCVLCCCVSTVCLCGKEEKRKTPGFFTKRGCFFSALRPQNTRGTHTHARTRTNARASARESESESESESVETAGQGGAQRARKPPRWRRKS